MGENKKEARKPLRIITRYIETRLSHKQIIEPDTLQDFLSCIDKVKKKETKEFILKNTKYGKQVSIYMLAQTKNPRYEELFWNFMLMETYHSFESYVLYIEKDRKFEKKFYEPRRETLHIVVEDLQDLVDTDLKFYGLSMPSRVGKSTICIFFLSWIAMRNPNSHSAMGGHSGKLAKGFYKELYNIFTSKEYCFKEVYTFWNGRKRALIEDKSAEDLTINLDEPSRFSTTTCRGIDGTWTGDIDISEDGFLYVDDLVRDRAHSLSPTRMEQTFQEYQNKMLDRMNDGAKVLMVGTLWNVLDPLERERKMHEGDDRYRFRRIPALNENDESNFQYKIKGFSTQYYHDMRDRLDQAEWMAKYMQKPFVREGLLFEPDNMQYFNGVLPNGTYRRYAPCDVALGGGDSLSMPIGFENIATEDVYIVDWVFSNAAKDITMPKVVNKIIEHSLGNVCFERNQGGGLYKDEVEKTVKERGIECLLTDRPAPNNMSKQEKINYYSPDIKKFYFLSPTIKSEDVKYYEQQGIKMYRRSQEYNKAMDELFTFVTEGKNVHDDAADSISQLARMREKKKIRKARIIKSPF